MRRIVQTIAVAAAIVLAGTWSVVTHGQTGPCSYPGCPDATFGGTGIVTTPSLQGNIGQIAVQTINGEERIVGLKTTPGTWVMARYTGSGQLDSSFGAAGIYTRTFSKGSTQAYSVLAQRDNKLLVLSYQPRGPQGALRLVVTRYLPSASSVAPGPFDTAFGNGGEAGTWVLHQRPVGNGPAGGRQDRRGFNWLWPPRRPQAPAIRLTGHGVWDGRSRRVRWR